MEHGREHTCRQNICVNLSPRQRRWLEAEVAAGRFASIEEAVEMAISALMDIETDNLAWAPPKVDEARASVTGGESFAGEDYLKSLEEWIASTRSS